MNIQQLLKTQSTLNIFPIHSHPVVQHLISYYKIIFRNTLNKDFRRQLFIKRYRCWSIIFRVTLNKDFWRQLFIKRYQFWSHETKQFYVLIIIIIINPLFSVVSKSIIKTNKYQLTKKTKMHQLNLFIWHVQSTQKPVQLLREKHPSGGCKATLLKLHFGMGVLL